MTVTHRLRSLDLNLLVALDVVLRTRSVSLAATEMGISQPAMSKTVGKLRRYFDDELLVRQGRQYELTAVARQLQAGVAEALGRIDSAIAPRKVFDVTQPFEVVVVASEVLALLTLPAVSLRMHAAAPRGVLRVVNPTSESGAAPFSIESLRAGTVDGLILPHGWLGGLEYIDLMTDEWAFAVADDDPSDHLDMDDLRRRPWVVVRLPNGELHRGMQQVLTAGVQPLIAVESSPTMAGHMFLKGTDRIAVVGKGLIARFGALLGIKAVSGPFPLGNYGHAFWWHPSRQDDPAHQWLRDTIYGARQTLGPGADK